MDEETDCAQKQSENCATSSTETKHLPQQSKSQTTLLSPPTFPTKNGTRKSFSEINDDMDGLDYDKPSFAGSGTKHTYSTNPHKTIPRRRSSHSPNERYREEKAAKRRKYEHPATAAHGTNEFAMGGLQTAIRDTPRCLGNERPKDTEVGYEKSRKRKPLPLKGRW
ncbi:hypothetical protein BU16DRAFT_557392 [Lophium mytilinum]|uniref:Uncharacterized protein n=1 Tax=Lophium mytilinum TaxID=390894 RepID=A0A6A6R2Q5_9PEZI|nr:hypothetical protein BU16DRAFT_557392 [Lophium mytilinum]